MKEPYQVLVVDSDTTLTSQVSPTLLSEGYCVTTAATGREALRLCRKHRYNLTLLDLGLPDMDGLDLIRQMSELSNGCEYIVMTNNAGLDTAVAAVRHRSIVGYETKPLDMSRLVALTRQVKARQGLEEALRQSESALRLVLEQMPCTIWTTDADLKVTSALGASAALALPPIDAMTGKIHDSSEPGPPSAGGPLAAHSSALEGVTESYEVDFNGKTFFCVVEPLRGSDSSIVGVIGIAMDMGEQKRHEDELRALSQRLADGQEAERLSIARELHDGLGQSLTAIKILLDRATVRTEGETAISLKEASALTGKLMAWVRELTQELRPTMLDDLGLVATLRWYLDRYTQQNRIPVDFIYSGRLRDLPAPVSTAAYRIVQEALNNVARHARSSEASVSVSRNGDAVSVEVSDRGAGFDTRRLRTDSAVGISGMRERAAGLGGTFRIESVCGSGTRVVAELPLSAPSKGGKRRRRRHE